MPLPRFLASPIALAALVTLANAIKPVTVDDTAYLLYARHIAENPLDPYGFTVFWWARPEPAMNVLCPPVVPYWLAVGIRLFGESPALLKLWLFPFVLVLAYSLRALLVRFARGTGTFMLPLLMLSPAVLPTLNLMLDIPATALALAAVALFVRAAERADGRIAALAGLVAALAMQSKYTALVVPAVFAWYGLTHRQTRVTLVAVGVCVGAFGAWELAMHAQYGESHFWHHARGGAGAPPTGASRVVSILDGKREIIPPLAGQFGCLGVGVGLAAWSLLRGPRPVLLALVWGAGFILIATVPRHWIALNGDTTAATVFWQMGGWVWLAGIALCAAVLLVRVRTGAAPRWSRGAWFLAGWFALEVVACVVLTPFPAARRVIGITLVGGILVARLASRLRRSDRARISPNWVVAVGIGAGVAVAGIDTLDASPEKLCAERAAVMIRDRPREATAWYVGHWGFQYYCERAGMQPLIAGETVARAGDFLVLPVPPDGGFHRPYAGFDIHPPPEDIAEVVGEAICNDWLSARTVPNFYGGLDPVSPRDHPRLRVRVYRLRDDWVMPR